MSYQEIISQYEQGLITETEFKNNLDKIGIHGVYEDGHFIGYDYYNQKWINTNNKNAYR